MQFLDTVTVIHAENEVYSVKVVDGCYWYGDTNIVAQGKGIVRDDNITVFFPKNVVAGNCLEIYKGDRIVYGMAEPIKSVNELVKYKEKITVVSVNRNTVGSKIDNLVVSGK